jgi:hypothetical protein
VRYQEDRRFKASPGNSPIRAAAASTAARLSPIVGWLKFEPSATKIIVVSSSRGWQ